MSLALLALILFASYMAIAFGIRTVVHLRATGSTGWRGISGAPFSASWLGGVLFVFALALGASAPALALSGIVGNLVELPAGVTWGGAALAVAGIIATYGSQVAMGKSWRIGVQDDERTELVTEGVFRIVRNPIFSCMLVTGVGLALLVPNALSFAGVICLFVAVEIQVRAVEEPYLERTHGERYAAYCRRVGRFVPGVGLR